MVYHFGKTGYLALQVQAVEGTADAFSGAAGEIGLPITEQPGIKPVIEKEFKNYYKKSSAAYSDYTVKRLAAEGDLQVPAFINGPLEAFNFGVFGKVTSTAIPSATGAFSNIFTMQDNLPIFTAAVGRDALSYQEFYDLRFGSLEIDMKPGEDIDIKTGTMGKGGDISKAAFTPTYPTSRSFAFDDLGVSIGGAANCDVSSVSLKIDRGLKSVRTACAAAAKGDNMIYTTTVEVSGSIEMYFQDYTEYKYWLGGATATAPTFDQNAATTKRELVIEATGPNVGTGTPAPSRFKITIPRAVYDSAEIDMPFDDRMMIKFDFKALYDPAAELALAGSGTIKAQVDSAINAQTTLV